MLSKQANDALETLRGETQGNPQAARALSQLEGALRTSHSDRETPGRKQSRSITREGHARHKSSGGFPPQAA